MKFVALQDGDAGRESLPVRGAWVEIFVGQQLHAGHPRRSPCGERGLKFLWVVRRGWAFLVAPRAGSVG